MKTGNFAKLGVCPSLLGFGCMRLKTKEDGKIDREYTAKVFEKAIKNGINYFDTAHMYHDGESQEFVGEALKAYDRSKLFIATKLPIMNIKSLEEAKQTFQKQLDLLQTSYVDFYLVHALNKNTWKNTVDWKVLEYLEEERKNGRIRFIGFSFHDKYDVFDEIIRYRKWDFCQLQINYLDTQIQQGIKGVQQAHALGIPVIVMEPTKGGTLTMLPDNIAALVTKQGISPANLAFRYVANIPGVELVLSGMSLESHVEENCKIFSNPTALSNDETALVSTILSEFEKRTRNGCTGCEYCMPCPHGVNIPRVFHLWNEYGKFGYKHIVKNDYFVHLASENRADKCKACGKCETKCPQAIKIINDLVAMHKEFTQVSQ